VFQLYHRCLFRGEKVTEAQKSAVVHSIHGVVRGCVAYAGAVFQLHHRCLFRGEEVTEAQVKIGQWITFLFFTTYKTTKNI
jgi:hypothetical protein